MSNTVEFSGNAVQFSDWEPIPLTPFESMMVLDERPGASMTCAAEFCFAGEVDRELFEAAYLNAMSRHKLLWAVIEERDNQQHWCAATELPAVKWNEEDVNTEFARMHAIDLTQECGVRTWVNTNAGESVLRFDFHHACCDAAGGMAFLEDILTNYDALVRGVEPELRPLNEDRLAMRDQVSIGGPLLSRIYRTFTDFKKSFRLILTKPATIPETGVCEPWQDRFVIRRVAEADLVRLRYAASEASATLNDLLLVEYMCALRDWLTESNPNAQKSYHIRIITPMSLRDREDKGLAAANKIGFSFISRSLKCLERASSTDWKKMISSINAELDQARRMLLPAQFLKKLKIARRSQRWFASLFSENRCWATAVMTQLGDPTRRFHHRFPRQDGRIVVGNLVLLDFVSCAPLRPLTRAILSTNTYGNELTLTMRCDPATISCAKAEEFLEDFVDRLLIRCDDSKN